MTDRNSDPARAGNPAPVPPTPAPRRGRLTLLIAAAAVVVAGTAGAFVTNAFSSGFGPHFGGPGWHHWRGGFDPARIEDRADRMVKHLAIEIDATPEQQAKLQTAVKGALKDVLPLREKQLALHQQAHDLLLQPNVDRAAIEKLRVEQMALADTFTKRIAQAMGDAAETLTPAQRQKLDGMLPPRGGFGPPWRR